MGLDSSIIEVNEVMEETREYEPSEVKFEEILYWRKNHPLHAFFADIYNRKHDYSIHFNNRPLRITFDIVEKLERIADDFRTENEWDELIMIEDIIKLQVKVSNANVNNKYLYYITGTPSL